MNRRRVLAIDDEPALRKLIVRALGAELDVTALASAEEALEAIHDGLEVDAIICDLMMPAMNGMEFLAHFRSERPHETDRIIFLTGGAFSPVTREFLASVPNLRVAKPFDPAELRATVLRHVAQCDEASRQGSR